MDETSLQHLVKVWDGANRMADWDGDSLFKNGDQMVCANYRGTILLSLLRKVFAKVLDPFAAECEVAGVRIKTSNSEALVLSRKQVDCPLHLSLNHKSSSFSNLESYLMKTMTCEMGWRTRDTICISGIELTLPHCCDKKQAVPEGKTLDLLVNLSSCFHP